MPQQEFTIPDYIRREATAIGLDPAIALGIAEKESNFNPTAMGPEITVGGQKVRAIGTFQFLPSTAKARGFDPNDPQANIQHGVRYLKELLDQHQDPYKALGAFGGVRTDTTYVPDALARIKKYQTQGAGDVGAPPPVPPPAATTPAAKPASKPPFKYPDVPTDRFGNVVKLPPDIQAERDLHNFLAEAPPTATDVPDGDVILQNLRRGWDFTKEALAGLNPRVIWEGLSHVGPAGASSEQVTAQHAANALDAWRAGKTVPAVDEGIKAIPFVGERLHQGAEYAAQGDLARAAGVGTDVFLQTAGPLLDEPRTTPRPFSPQLTPERAAAVAWGRAHGIEMPVSTASGSGFAANVEKATTSSLAGEHVTTGARLRRGEQMEAAGRDIATRVSPGGPVDPEASGLGQRTALETGITAADAAADVAYDRFRQILNDPQYTRQVQVGTARPSFMAPPQPVFQAMQLPADITPVKAALRPIYNEFMELYQRSQGAASPGLTVLGEILNGPDYKSAAMLERDLSTLKSLAYHGVEMPELRTRSQGIAARAVHEVTQAVDAAVAQAPGAQQALTEGRAATTRKYDIARVRDQLHPTSAVSTYEAAVRPQDVNIEHLRNLQTHAPQEIPRIGRAYLEQRLNQALGPTGDLFTGILGASREWFNLGPETRRILYGPLAPDLDNFFVLGRELAKNPNPSGTAIQHAVAHGLMSGTAGAAGGIGPGLGTAAAAGAWHGPVGGALASLMNSRAGVRLLVEGFTIPANTQRAARWSAAILAELGEQHRRDEAQQGMPPPAPPTRVSTPPPPR